MSKTLKVAVIGMGHGRNHVRVFNEYIAQTEVVMVCDAVESRAQSAAKDLGIQDWTTHYADVLARQDVDLIAICTPCHIHGVQTLAALDHGKHVMVEVPMENQSLETLWKILYMAERRNLKVQMDNQLRWMAPTVHMRRLVESGKLGEVFYVETEYVHDIEGMTIRGDGSPTFRWGLGEQPQGTINAGGGLYAVDGARWLMGEQFVEVTGFGNKKNLPYRQVNDHEVALFKTASGAIARVVCSKGPKRPTIEYAAVYGTKGTLETSGRLPHPPDGPGLYGCFKEEDPGYSQVVYGWMYADSQPAAPSAKAPPEPHPMKRLEVPALNVDLAMARKVGHGGVEYFSNTDLVNAILDDHQPPCNVYESARSCAGAICAVQSIQEGRPVRVPEIVDRSDAIKRFGPLPTAHQTSSEL